MTSPPRDYRAQGRHWRREVARPSHRSGESLKQRLAVIPVRVFFHTLQFLLNALPLSAALELGAALGRLCYVVLPGRRKVTLRNLRLALGKETTELERRRIARETFANFGRMIVEFLRFPRLDKDKVNALVACDRYEHLTAAHAPGRGVIGLSAHLGNFEFVAATANLQGYPPNSLMGRKTRLPVVDRILQELRRSLKVETIYSRDGVKQVLKRLRAGEGVGIVLDQNMRRSVGIFVNTFGLAASTTPTPALLAARLRCEVLPAFCVRQGIAGRHRLIMFPALPFVKSEDRDRDILLNTQRMTQVIEAVVRRYPEQWFWFHKRWRCRPPGEEGPPGPAELPAETVAERTAFAEYMVGVEAQLDAAEPGPFTALLRERSEQQQTWPLPGWRAPELAAAAQEGQGSGLDSTGRS